MIIRKINKTDKLCAKCFRQGITKEVQIHIERFWSDRLFCEKHAKEYIKGKKLFEIPR